MARKAQAKSSSLNNNARTHDKVVEGTEGRDIWKYRGIKALERV